MSQKKLKPGVYFCIYNIKLVEFHSISDNRVVCFIWQDINTGSGLLNDFSKSNFKKRYKYLGAV